MSEAQPLPLTPGPLAGQPTPGDLQRRIAVLRATVEKFLPDFAKTVQSAARQKLDNIILHQDAFAAGFDTDEYTLLGCAIKYAGLYGVRLQVIGRNAETR